MLRLFTFGGLGLETADGSPGPRLRRPQLAMLAVLAASGERGVTRERLASLFWPESDEEHARHSARQVLYALRQELGGDVLKSTGSNLSLDPAAITSDVGEFRQALSSGERERAVRLARGQFLDAFYLPGAAGFERWMEEERGRISAAISTALLSLATDATRARQVDAAAEWWRELTLREPLSGRFAVGYLRALAERGDRAEALSFARQHELVMRRELEADPDPEVKRIEAELRAAPAARSNGSPPVSRAAEVVINGASPNGTPVAVFATAPDEDSRDRPRRRPWRPMSLATAAVFLLLAVTAAYARQRGWLRSDSAPVLAVGLIREAGGDSASDARVMTDMLATNLARVNGLRVLANSRLLELIRPGQDSGARYAEAARRAGASELLEGYLTRSADGLTLELRRVELRSGLVTDVYRAAAGNRHALVDSLTRIVANELGLVSPSGSVADATTNSLVAYRFYEEGLRAYYAGDGPSARRLMHAALAEDSTFAMAAWFEVRFARGGRTPDGRTELQARERAIRLAERAPERERLTILASLLVDNNDPRAVAAAESLTVRYPDDPQALMALSLAYFYSGNWAGSVAAGERAIALDSMAQAGGSRRCGLCDSYLHVAEVYSWWDSLPAALRTTRRFHAAEPRNRYAFDMGTLYAVRMGDFAQASEWHRRRIASGGLDAVFKLRVDLYSEAYDTVEQAVQPLLASPSATDRGEAFWSYFMALRNQGRLEQATALIRRPELRPPHVVFEAILALERGDAAAAARWFDRTALVAAPTRGIRSRDLAWRGVRIGMAAADAGDIARVRALADSVEQWGRESLYGRDPKLHHYLRGRLYARAGRHVEAIRAYQAAIHSQSLGFTRVNYDLARSLLQAGRPGDAIATLQSAVRGVTDASNLYVSRTDLHELLADAFDRAGLSDSAAVHYRKVVEAWRRADPLFHARRDRAADWLARNALNADR